jgi:ribulose-phosphate 3-epimerase
MIEVLPSILSADFARLGEQVGALENAGCRTLHIDIMDGHFVPNLTMGPLIVKSLRKVSKLTFDVHLMVTDPDRYAPLFIDAGADRVLVHQETCPHLDRTLNMIRSEGAKAGVVLNPATPVSVLEDVLEIVDYVLIMSVNPGFGGQQFIPYSLKKVRQLAAMRRERGLQFPIEIDGGVSLENVASVVHAGVEWIVAGSSVFHTVNPVASFEQMQQVARDASAVRV